MTKLTNESRHRICDKALLSAPVTAQIKICREKLSNLAVSIYNDTVKPEVVNAAIGLINEIKNTPFSVRESHLHIMDGVMVDFGGVRAHVNYPEDGIERYSLKSAPIYEADHKYSIAYFNLDEKLTELATEKYGLEIRIMAILNSCTTLSQLKAEWPECVNFLD